MAVAAETRETSPVPVEQVPPNRVIVLSEPATGLRVEFDVQNGIWKPWTWSDSAVELEQGLALLTHVTPRIASLAESGLRIEGWVPQTADIAGYASQVFILTRYLMQDAHVLLGSNTQVDIQAEAFTGQIAPYPDDPKAVIINRYDPDAGGYQAVPYFP